MANFGGRLRHLGVGLQQGHHHRPRTRVHRGESARRQRQQTQGDGRLVASGQNVLQDSFPLRQTRRRFDGNKIEQKIAILLQLAVRRFRRLRAGLAVSRHQVGQVRASIPFPAFPSDPSMSEESGGATGRQDDFGCSILERQELVPIASIALIQHQEVATRQEDCEGHGSEPVPSQCVHGQAGRLHSYWQGCQDSQELSQRAKTLVEASWRSGTEQQYASKWRSWLEWTQSHRISQTSPSVTDVMEFLTDLFHRGLDYSTINGYRSALSVTLQPIKGVAVGKHHLVCRLLKGIYNKKPPQKKVWFLFNDYDNFMLIYFSCSLPGVFRSC